MTPAEELEAVLRSKGRPTPGVLADRQAAVIRAFISNAVRATGGTSTPEFESHAMEHWFLGFQYQGTPHAAAWVKTLWRNWRNAEWRTRQRRKRLEEGLLERVPPDGRGTDEGSNVLMFPGARCAVTPPDGVVATGELAGALSRLDARLLGACPPRRRARLEQFMAARKAAWGFPGWFPAVQGNNLHQLLSRGRDTVRDLYPAIQSHLEDGERVWLDLYLATTATPQGRDSEDAPGDDEVEP